ncbi:MAG: low molecular weight phosphatase family protein [Chthoniobacterales bacterium]|jgi:protein-tyrosine phosphatase
MTKPRTKRLLFICSGNYYRSRLAEILFNHQAAAQGLDWEADSRGLINAHELRGLSEHAAAHLKEAGLENLAAEPRDPKQIEVDNLTEADLVIALCRNEHKPMIEERFLSLAKALHASGKLRYWNVYDIPGRPHAILRLLGGGHKGPCQPSRSGTEHIALAVRDLVRELAG